jgi:hypothetical protein
MMDDSKWLIVGDFNLIRSLTNRNKPGGNLSEMFAFNEAISKLSLVEIPLEGYRYTWTNKQQDPLLQRLDWFFSSSSWASSFPNTWASALSRDTSDQTPCLISAITSVPKPHTFRFENYWLEHHQFPEILQLGWNIPIQTEDKAKRISLKFKNLRKVLKAWKNQLPSLTKTIQSCKDTILLFDNLEEHRDLSLEEWNFRDIVAQHLQPLLSQQRTYWKQRGAIKWVKFGDECTKFFHANASIKHCRNSISVIRDESGKDLTNHEEKAQYIWLAFRERLGVSVFTEINLDLSSLINPSENLDWLHGDFTKEEIDNIIKNLPSYKSPGPDGFNGDFLKKMLADHSSRFL